MPGLRSWWIPCLAGLVVAPMAIGCTSQPQPRPLPPLTMAPTPPDMQDEPITNAAESLEPPAEFTRPVPQEPAFEIIEETPTGAGGAGSDTPIAEDPLTVVVDPGTETADQPQSLFAAAEAEKERRDTVGDSTIVLTNKNLEEYSKGQLTFIEDEGAEATSSATEQGPETTPLSEEDETYWRNRVLDIRMDWRESLDRIGELEERIAGLRRSFYAEDDPFYRDSQIKPTWDQAIVDLETARRDAESSQQELEVALEEGRRAGALPGWLREGIELEPTEEELEDRLPPDAGSRFHEPGEPVVVDEGDGGR